MKIIAVTNRKGGVGKSTMTTHIAAGLALAGLDVGIVDTDSQGHAGLMLKQADENGLYDVLIREQSINDTVRLIDPQLYAPDGQELYAGHLWLLPSSDLTYRIPHELSADKHFLFLETLETFAEQKALDVILIDTSPTLSLFDGAIWLAADAYIYVTECERMSFDGIQSAISQMRNVNRQREKYLNRSSQILGIIPNKMRPNTMVHRSNIAALAEAYPGLVWPPVTLRTAWVEATNMQEMIYRYAPNGQERRDADALCVKTMEATGWHPTTNNA